MKDKGYYQKKLEEIQNKDGGEKKLINKIDFSKKIESEKEAKSLSEIWRLKQLFEEGIIKDSEEQRENEKIVLMSKFSPEPYVQKLSRKTRFKCDKHKILWRYDFQKGIWEKNPEQWIRNQLRKNLMGSGQQKRQYVEEIISFIKDYYYDKDFEAGKNPYLIAFNNKIFDLKNDKWINFSPEYNITSKLNLNVDEKNTFCPKIDNFFEEAIGKEHKQILYDLCSYLLFKGYPYQKAFFVFGPANTGKSVFMNFLESFLGEDNYTSIEPRKIGQDKHITTRMLHKMANIVSDIDYRELDDITLLKKVTGGDTIFMRPMYHEGFEAHVTAKQVFSTNKLPNVKEKTRAWYRRVYTIPFTNIVDRKKENPFLKDEITQKEEMEAFAYRCIENLRSLYKRNFRFHVDIDVNKMAEVYEKFSNPIHMFIAENCVNGNKNDHRDNFVFKWEFKEKLNEWLKKNHFPPAKSREINEFMKENYNESNRKAPLKDKNYRVWTGISWKSSYNHEYSNHFNHFNQELKKVYIMEKVLQTPLNRLNRLSKDFRHIFVKSGEFYHSELVSLIKKWDRKK